MQRYFRQGYKATPILIAINILVFLLLIVANGSLSEFTGRSLLQFGANFSPLVERGEWWRLLSSVFLHLSISHLAFNSISLHILGKIIEPLLGTFVFVLVYLMTGILASLSSYLFNPGVLSAGASGAIFGLFGLFIGLLLSNIIKPHVRKQMLHNVAAVLVINIGLSFIFPVDNSAHIGGLVSGLILGVILLPHIKRQITRLWLQNTPPNEL